MELWDAEYIDMLGAGHIQFDRDGGHFSFGAVQAGIDCHYGPASVHFTWFGNDEMTEVSGDGDANLEEDGIIIGESASTSATKQNSPPSVGRFSAAG